MDDERGQATIEWAGLVLLVAIVLAVGGAVIHPPPFAQRIACAVLAGCRGEAAALEAAYGPDVGGLVRALAPNLAYARGTLTLPVDFRRCRRHGCADAPDTPGADVWRSDAGRQATVFTHAVDHRRIGGYLYVQYWLYYPDSTYNGTAQAVTTAGGDVLALTPAGMLIKTVAGHHEDDWESYQVRVDAQGRMWSRASAHHGYAGRRTWPNLNEVGVEPTLPDVAHGRLYTRRRTQAWTPLTGWTHVTRGSHAGFIISGPGGEDRRTASNGLDLVPIEQLGNDVRESGFAIVPPWRKPVYREPDRTDT